MLPFDERIAGPNKTVARAFLFYKIARALKFLIWYHTFIRSQDVAQHGAKDESCKMVLGDAVIDLHARAVQKAL